MSIKLIAPLSSAGEYARRQDLLLPFKPSHHYSCKILSGVEPKHSQIKTLTLFGSISRATSSTNARIRNESPLKEPLKRSNNVAAAVLGSSFCASGLCSCGRRHFVGASGPERSNSPNSSEMEAYQAAILKRFHPPRPDWYEELYAMFLAKYTKAYEAEVAGYKAELFSKLRGMVNKVLELGIGTGPNLKYYAGDGDVHVYGVDPNKKMEKYAREAAVAAGKPTYVLYFAIGLINFRVSHNLSIFFPSRKVGEELPLSDASMDAVIGTLVLCSVQDVDLALQEVKRVLKPGGLYIFIEHVAAQDRTLLKFLQGILHPLQQIVADGCHLTRQTGKHILEAGFSDVDIKMASVPFFPVSPHVYGIACK